ncbi:hypothetical protein A2U01_0023630 [Trifolium medium]|uniref:Uncharacterized protein n=1 Tax=Trifolium medium TaxID=97028 RepID=A0A392NRW9_9FABA|nr:hypothetical protein [Trifolium medium]
MDPQLSWVGPEPRGIASTITPTAGGTYTLVEEGNVENWEVYCPAEEKRVCSPYSDDGFAMYEFAFKDLKFRLPFSNLAAGVFGWLHLAPSQLHQNSLAFIRAFEILYEHGVQVTRRVAQFPLKWTRRHFDGSTDSYLTKDETLSKDERVGLDKLKKFVDSFKPTRYVTKAGAQALDSKGRPRFCQPARKDS